MKKFDIEFDLNKKLILSVTGMKLAAPAETSPLMEKRVENDLLKIKKMFEKQKKQTLNTIQNVGFSCRLCGKCCKREEYDNSVYLLPEDISKIETLGIRKEIFLLPLLPDLYNRDYEVILHGNIFDENKLDELFNALAEQTDENGKIHTFGWMLQRKKDGDCIFLDSENKCLIYEQRPSLCQTYPFFMDEKGIFECECAGFDSSKKTNPELSTELLNSLLKRTLWDHEDYLLTSGVIQKMYPKKGVEDEKKEQSRTRFKRNFKDGFIRFAVYDGGGVYEVEVSLKNYNYP
ncbi:MAG: YkgJ family cysteine cluster protein [Methanimicrococcus sp.]|nr:YkgJ family cysteine cluster protein [Methanimicrococcus sp.]